MKYYDSLRPERFAFNNSTPFTVPGKIEAEQYDLGMPGTTYYDTTKGILLVGFGDPIMLIFSQRITNI